MSIRWQRAIALVCLAFLHGCASMAEADVYSPPPRPAAVPASPVYLQEKLAGQDWHGTINWEQGYIQATAKGFSNPAQVGGVVQAELLALRAGRIIAFARLLEIIKIVRVDPTNSVGTLMQSQPNMTIQLQGMMRGAEPIYEHVFTRQDGWKVGQVTARMYFKDLQQVGLRQQYLLYGSQPVATYQPYPRPAAPPVRVYTAMPAPPAQQIRVYKHPVTSGAPAAQAATPSAQTMQPAGQNSGAQPQAAAPQTESTGAQAQTAGAQSGGSTVTVNPPAPAVTSPAASAGTQSALPAAKPATQLAALSPQVKPADSAKPMPAGIYTGLIVDASGLEAKPALFPSVVEEESGRQIFGLNVIDVNMAATQGVVGYAPSLEAARKNPRVGSNPLVVTAIQATGLNKARFSVGSEDALLIKQADEKGAFLSHCKVVIVIN